MIWHSHCCFCHADCRARVACICHVERQACSQKRIGHKNGTVRLRKRIKGCKGEREHTRVGRVNHGSRAVGLKAELRMGSISRSHNTFQLQSHLKFWIQIGMLGWWVKSDSPVNLTLWGFKKKCSLKWIKHHFHKTLSSWLLRGCRRWRRKRREGRKEGFAAIVF